MSKDVRWIDTPAELAAFAEALPAGTLGIDTEADSFHRYWERMCLLQIHDGTGVALVDPLACPDLAPLREALEDGGRRKVVHGGDYDVRLLRRDHGIAPQGLFDTMLAARLCGVRSFGLAALLSERMGIDVDKTHQRADWAQRPLPERMRVYAAEDTRHLVALAAMLENELERLGRRSWAEEEFRRLEAVRWNDRPEDPDRWRRVKAAGSLDRKGLALLRAVWTWREERARRLDRPPFRILREETLLAASRLDPVVTENLAALPGAPRSWRDGGGGVADLAEALAAAWRLGDGELPEPNPSRRPVRDPAFERRLATLRALRDRRAGELGIESSVLASRSVLEAVQKDLDAGGDGNVADLRAWQREVLGSLASHRSRL